VKFLLKAKTERKVLMRSRFITTEIIEKFRLYLLDEEKSDNTIEKYLLDVLLLQIFARALQLQKKLSLHIKKS